MNKETPQQYSLPTVTGYAAVGGYHKNQENEVTIDTQINIIDSGNYFQDAKLIAVLPEGFRPNQQFNRAAVYFSPWAVGAIEIKTNGEIYSRIVGASTTKNLYINITFLAR